MHKAKGLEAERIFILRPDLMPHPAAWKPVDRDQESNIEYVAITRAKSELYFVHENINEINERDSLPEPVKMLEA